MKLGTLLLILLCASFNLFAYDDEPEYVPNNDYEQRGDIESDYDDRERPPLPEQNYNLPDQPEPGDLPLEDTQYDDGGDGSDVEDYGDEDY